MIKTTVIIATILAQVTPPEKPKNSLRILKKVKAFRNIDELRKKD